MPTAALQCSNPACGAAMAAPAQQCTTCGALVSGLVLSGRFRIEALLGQGGMGAVYRATEIESGRLVAVKVLTTGVGTIGGIPADVRARFAREARLAEQLDHPNIVRVLYSTSDGPFVYLVMPLMTGGPLSRRLAQRRPIDPMIALIWLRQIGSALDYAHQRLQPIIHRDVKPGNLLFHEDGRLCLADFGIARLASESGSTDAEQITRTGIILGSLQYMAPEQIGGHPVPASDQYSTGVVLYEMLTGVLPFDSADNFALMMQHLNATPPPPCQLIPALPAGVDGVVMRALAKEPAHRFPTVSALAAAFEAALTGAPTAQVPGPAQPRTTQRIPSDLGAPPALSAALPSPPPASLPQSAGDPHGELPTRAATRQYLTAGWAPTDNRPPTINRSAPDFAPPGAPTQAPKRRRKTGLIVLASVLAVLLFCALGLAGLSQLHLSKAPSVGAAPTSTASRATQAPTQTAVPNSFTLALQDAERQNPVFADPLLNDSKLWVLSNGAEFESGGLFLPGVHQEGGLARGKDGSNSGGSAVRPLDVPAHCVIEFDVTYAGGLPAIYGVGLLSSLRSGYGLALSSDGAFGLLYTNSGLPNAKILVSKDEPGLALQADMRVRVAVLIQGDQIAFFMNGQYIDFTTYSHAFKGAPVFVLANFASATSPGGDVTLSNLDIYPAA